MRLLDTEALEKPFGLRVVRTDRAFAPTGEPHVVLCNAILDASEDMVKRAAERAFTDYAEGKTGVLYWRTKPEIRNPEDTGTPHMWSFFMRLLISNKDPRL